MVLALSRVGAREVVVVNRTPERGRAAAALAGEVGRVGRPGEVEEMDLVVNATPVGMTEARPAGGAGDGGDLAPLVDPERLGPGQVLVDLVYHPPTTTLLEVARRRGVTAVNGMGMLVHQAALAFTLWTGEDPPLGAMRSAVTEVLLSGGP